MKPRLHRATSLLRCAPLTLSALSLVTFLIMLAFVSLAHAAPGDLAWQRLYNGPGNGNDRFSYPAPAPGGGVYVAGTTLVTNQDVLAARYDASGQRLWLRTFNGSANKDDVAFVAASDGHGDLIVAGEANAPEANMVVIKYGPGGKRLWARVYDDKASSMESAGQVAVDPAGAVYIAGSRYTAASGYDIVLVKYSPSGARKWVRLFAPPGSTNDRLSALATDAAGNVYLTGGTVDAGTGTDVVTLKYDPAGHRRWVRRWDGSGHPDFGYGMAVSRAGAVYVAGGTEDASSVGTAIVLKYGAGGRLKWSRLITNATILGDQLISITLLGNGDVAAAGDSYSGPTNSSDVLVARLSPGGTTRWLRTYNGPDSHEDTGRYVTVGPLGAIYVGALSYGTTTASDILTLKYSSAGVLRWARRYTNPDFGSSESDGQLIAPGRAVYVTGFHEAVSGSDAVLLKYIP